MEGKTLGEGEKGVFSGQMVFHPQLLLFHLNQLLLVLEEELESYPLLESPVWEDYQGNAIQRRT